MSDPVRIVLGLLALVLMPLAVAAGQRRARTAHQRLVEDAPPGACALTAADYARLRWAGQGTYATRGDIWFTRVLLSLFPVGVGAFVVYLIAALGDLATRAGLTRLEVMHVALPVERALTAAEAEAVGNAQCLVLMLGFLVIWTLIMMSVREVDGNTRRLARVYARLRQLDDPMLRGTP